MIEKLTYIMFIFILGPDVNAAWNKTLILVVVLFNSPLSFCIFCLNATLSLTLHVHDPIYVTNPVIIFFYFFFVL